MKTMLAQFAITFALLISSGSSRACDPNENCTFRGPDYPCPTWAEPLRMCASYYDSPECIVRRSACQRFDFCNVGSGGGAGGMKPSCTNCSSNFSGDVGKADCLLRHQGDHVDFGKCNPAECSTINVPPSGPLPTMMPTMMPKK
jgi:hypothetical protein